ncbi:MAG TPA: dTDP-4-dehydrorhamnose 3,5-epimerase family protein [Candidatus Sulfotelmatobacter sp.]|nr:dTDP-4-dehydrorhamnose 3,5-epimerase family protein [Candidatus Sulfotelmatobacter sp.]
MKANEVTVDWLQSLDFLVQPAGKATIHGVIVRDLTVHLDGRGEVTELYSRPWMKDGLESVEHVYQSATDYGVVKCWHLHQVHTDQFTVTRGKLQVSLVDVRESSPTFRHVNTLFLGSLKPRLIKIPPMILHGWKALTAPEVLVVNFQSHVYDVKDEFKFPWDTVLSEIWEPLNG